MQMKRKETLELENFKSLLFDSLKENPLLKYIGQDQSDFRTERNFFLFKSLIVHYDKTDKIWYVVYRTHGVEDILSFINSHIGVKEYLESIESVVSTLKSFLPSYIKGSRVSFDDEDLVRCFAFLKLREEAARVTKSKSYFTTNDEVIVPEIGLSFALSSSELEVDDADEMFDGRKILWLPYDSKSDTKFSLEEPKVLNIINRISLSNMFSGEVLYNDYFTDRFNYKMSTYLHDGELKNSRLDFYTEMQKINPSVDLYEIFYLNEITNVTKIHIKSPIPNLLKKEKGVLLKTLQGYYYAKENLEELGFISLEEYDSTYKR